MTLAVREIDFGYHAHTPVLRAVTAEFRPGRICVLAGPNASGKTTLLRLLLALRTPWMGHITLDSRPVGRLRARERAHRLAYAPQDPEVAGPYTARQVVRTGRFALPRDESAITAALERVDLADRADDPFVELSAGQRRRVALARALAQLSGATDAWLLADEPLANLDPLHASRAAIILRELADSGLGVIAVVHDATAARRLADDALLLTSQGAVLAQGPSEQVLTTPLLEQAFSVPFEEVAGSDGQTIIPRWTGRIRP